MAENVKAASIAKMKNLKYGSMTMGYILQNNQHFHARTLLFCNIFFKDVQCYCKAL